MLLGGGDQLLDRLPAVAGSDLGDQAINDHEQPPVVGAQLEDGGVDGAGVEEFAGGHLLGHVAHASRTECFAGLSVTGSGPASPG